MHLKLLYVAAGLVTAAGAVIPQPGYTIQTPVSYDLLARSGTSSLFEMNLPNNGVYFDGKVLLLDLKGSRTDMGVDTGVLLGDRWAENYQSLISSLLSSVTTNAKLSALIQEVLEFVMDRQWEENCVPHTPSKFIDELAGLSAGALSAFSIPDVGKMASRGIVLANLPGDGDDVAKMLLADLSPKTMERLVGYGAALKKLTPLSIKDILASIKFGHNCDMYALWGSRTTNSTLMTGRNLDWSKDTGVSKSKLVTVFHPTDGGFAHATIGFAGLWGAIAGMSSQGLSVHEANLESKYNTLKGFPWVLRLRHVMEEGSDLESGLAAFNSGPNTVGFNHQITSAKDAAMYDAERNPRARGAVLLETDKVHTATFFDNDERESTNGGNPFVNAVFRTNHGYDDETRANYNWPLDGGAFKDSSHRYDLFVDMFNNAPEYSLSYVDAVSICSILGSKGGEDPYVCNGDYADGSNVISAAFLPGSSVMYAAWENGHAEGWTPAACNSYVEIDLSAFF